MKCLKLGDHDMFILAGSFPAWTPTASCPESSTPRGGSNYSRYNDEVDKLIDQAKPCRDGPEREKVYMDSRRCLRSSTRAVSLQRQSPSTESATTWITSFRAPGLITTSPEITFK